MKIEDLEIGKEYYLDVFKKEKGIYKGQASIGVYFKPTTKTAYITNKILGDEFCGCVGFHVSHLTFINPVT